MICFDTVWRFFQALRNTWFWLGLMVWQHLSVHSCFDLPLQSNRWDQNISFLLYLCECNRWFHIPYRLMIKWYLKKKQLYQEMGSNSLWLESWVREHPNYITVYGSKLLLLWYPGGEQFPANQHSGSVSQQRTHVLMVGFLGSCSQKKNRGQYVTASIEPINVTDCFRSKGNTTWIQKAWSHG